MRWGSDHEAEAVAAFERVSGLTTQRCGFVIDHRHCWLGASPDRKVLDPSESSPEGLVEVKCPFSAKDGCVKDLLDQRNGFIVQVDGELQLNRKHNYFFQVLGGLAITHCQWCDFVVWTKNDLFGERNFFDSEKWQACFPVLNDFYFQFIVPELSKS